MQPIYHIQRAPLYFIRIWSVMRSAGHVHVLSVTGNGRLIPLHCTIVLCMYCHSRHCIIVRPQSHAWPGRSCDSFDQVTNKFVILLARCGVRHPRTESFTSKTHMWACNLESQILLFHRLRATLVYTFVYFHFVPHISTTLGLASSYHCWPCPWAMGCCRFCRETKVFCWLPVSSHSTGMDTVILV